MWDVARLALLFTTNTGLLSEGGTWTNPHTERQPKIWPSYTDDIKHLSALALYLSYANEMKQSLSPSQELFFFLSLTPVHFGRDSRFDVSFGFPYNIRF